MVQDNGDTMRFDLKGFLVVNGQCMVANCDGSGFALYRDTETKAEVVTCSNHDPEDTLQLPLSM